MKQLILNNVVVEVLKDSPCGIISTKINAKGREVCNHKLLYFIILSLVSFVHENT